MRIIRRLHTFIGNTNPPMVAMAVPPHGSRMTIMGGTGNYVYDWIDLDLQNNLVLRKGVAGALRRGPAWEKKLAHVPKFDV